jgi:tetratricopeptide (TPR) repeat protein
MKTTRAGLIWGLLLGILAHAPLARAAEEVQWRRDYNQARVEAQQSGRLLVIDIGTEACYWCRQLDERTLHEPSIVALLNERCIPLRIDANRTPKLTEALQIRSYPTLIYAGPDGKILGYQEGFIEALKFRDQVNKAVTIVAPPDWMQRDYQDAVKSLGQSDYARTVSLLRNVLEDGKDRPVQAKARQLLQDVEGQAADRLARGRQLIHDGQTAQAIDVLTELSRVYPGTTAAREGSQLLLSLTSRPEANPEQRARRARDLLAQARDDYRSQQFLCALDRCETLAHQFPDLAEGNEANQLAADIKGNPEFARAATEQLTERLGGLYLSLGDGEMQRGQLQQAAFYFQRVLQTVQPGSPLAETAQARLSLLRGQPGAGSGDLRK